MIEGALPVARALHFAATLILEGSLAFQVWVLRPVFDGPGPLRSVSRWIDVLALPIAFVSGILWVGLVGADLAGTSLLTALWEGADWVLLTQTLAGAVDRARDRLSPARVLVVLLTQVIPAKENHGRLCP